MFLFLFKVLFSWVTGKEGMGSGDPELIAFIGSFTGITGCWFSLLFGSIVGSMLGIGIMLVTKSNQLSTKIPFGPFLAFGALIFVLFQETILRFIQ